MGETTVRVRRSAALAGLGAGVVAAVLLLASPASAQTGTNPTLQPWSSTTSLPEGRSRNGAVFNDGYLYLVGGVNSAGTIATVSYAPVNANGTVGPWLNTTPLPAARRTVRPVVWNDNLYLIGGNDGAAFQATSYVAPLNADGTVGAWSTTTPLPAPQTSHATVANGGYMYVVGGNNGSTCVNTVRYAPINADGTLGAWSTTSALPAPRCGNVEAVTVANGFMYAAGGYDNSNVTRSVFYAPISANGTLGAWQTNANSFITGREYNGLEALNGYLYTIAGQDTVSGAGSSTSVEVAALNANGSVGAFSATTSLPGPRGELATEVVDGRVYAIGGGTGASGANPQTSVYYTSQAAADAVPPTVSLTAPANGATVSGAVNVNANAADDIGVAGVQFLLDGNNLGAEDTSSPYSVSWSTLAASNGSHTLAARARDGAGNLTTSTSVTVTVSNSGSSGLNVAYGMESTAGTTLVDSSPSANNATLTNGTWTTSGRSGNAVVFNGTTSRARSTADVTLGSTWTIEGWVNNPGNSAYETLWTVGTTRDVFLENGLLSFYSDAASPDFGAVPTGGWQHVAITYDGTSLRAFLNGAPLGAAQTATIPSVSAPLQLGAWIFGASDADYFSGTLDEVRVYGRALSQAEIAADMNTAVAPPAADTTPPVLSNGQPTGSLAPGTTQATLQVTSNENATCRYATTAGTAYSAMTNTFATTGGTAHATTVTGLTNGSSYAFYVRCQDTSTNPTTSDFGITFTVAAPDSVAPTVSVTAPANGATVAATVNVNANAADNTGVVGVQFLLDGNNLGAEDTSSPYSVAWDTTTATNGSHTLTARARDAAGNQTTATPVTVTVTNTLPGPLVAYGLEEGNGTTANSTPSGPAATITSGTWTTAGRYGNAVVFNGTASRVRSDANVSLPTTFTMEAWVNNPSIQTYETIMTVGNNRDLYLQSGQLRFSAGGGFISFGAALPTNTWTHVAVTYDGTTMRAYVNGTPYGTTQTINLPATSSPLQIGAWMFGSGNADYFSGTIDEVRVYGRALSQAEIAADLANAITDPPADTTPPVLSNGQPTGSLAPGTTQATLQVTSNENATCRYATTAGTAYSAMTNTFATTGGTAHATTVTGLTNGSSYAFYVRCQDTSTNPTTSDFGITFTVAAPDSVPPTVSVTAPANGATVAATVNVNANAADNTGVIGVQFLLDGNNLGAEDTSSPYSVAWDTTTATNGSHTLTARARDAAGNQTTATPVTVTVTNTLAGPLVAYGLNETSGTTAASTPGGQPATVTSGTWGPGRYGNAVVFDGTASRVRSDANVNLPTTFTMEAWVNNPSIQTYETIMTVGNNRDLYLQSGQLRFSAGGGFISFGAPLPTNTWTHVAVTYDGTTMRAYVNGAPYGTAQTINLPATSSPLQIGAWIFGNNNADYFSGTIDEVRVYGRALSQAEVAADQSSAL